MRRAIQAAALLLLGSGAVFAFTLTPITRDFSPSGPGTVQSFQLENEGNENVALRIKIFTRDMDENGKENLLPAEGLFLVYPPQVVLKPKSVQTLKVQWRGQAKVDTELAFRLLVEQLPVNFEEHTAPGGRIRILLRYMGALYIVPPKPKAEVILDSFAPASGGTGEKGLELVFHNKGNAHVLLSDLEVSLLPKETASQDPLVLKDDALKGLNGENLLPGKKRRIFLPLPERFIRDDTQISFKFKPSR